MKEIRSFFSTKTISVMITGLGVIHSIYHHIMNTRINLMNFKLPGAIIGVIAILAGCSYCVVLKRKEKSLVNS